MNLKVLGRYGVFPAKNSCTSGYLVTEKKTNIMMEMGSGIFSRISNYIAPEKLDAVIISHYHHDHMCDLLFLDYYLNTMTKLGKLDHKILLYVPFLIGKQYESLQQLQFFEFVTVKEKTKYKVGDVTLEFFPMNHNITCMGVKITAEDAVLSYTGDTRPNDNLKKLFGGSDAVLCHCAVPSKYRTDEISHLSTLEGATLAKEHDTKLLISHLNAAHDEKEIEAEAKSIYENSAIVKELTDYLI